jgi:hypothetical protein
MKRKNISLREGIRRWYNVDRENIRYKLFILSAAWCALLLYAALFKAS